MNRTSTHSLNKPDWLLRLGLLLCAVGLSLGAYLALSGSATSAEGARRAPAAAPKLVTKPIEQVRVGERVVGRNPLREQVAHVEPDPATWRQVSLFLTKESGNGLWIELLRPLTWIEEQSAHPGATIFLALHEMGAVGDAQVLAVSPCPKIEPGAGPLVTGTFKHQANAHSHVIRLALEDQPAPTTVTSNHPYWSADRQAFIPAGNLRPGELVDTALGPKRVLSLTPLAHTGFLYNLETTEHVYRVGSVGTLVHNNCGTTAARRAPAIDNYRGRFNAERHAQGLPRLPDDYDAHHRIPQEYIGHAEFQDFDFHHPGNIKGVKGSRSDVNTHQLITNEWAEFRRLSPNATRSRIEAFAAEIDARYSQHWF